MYIDDIYLLIQFNPIVHLNLIILVYYLHPLAFNMCTFDFNDIWDNHLKAFKKKKTVDYTTIVYSTIVRIPMLIRLQKRLLFFFYYTLFIIIMS